MSSIGRWCKMASEPTAPRLSTISGQAANGAGIAAAGVSARSVASLLVAEGIKIGDELVTTVALAIIVTLLLQSMTKPWLARRLGLGEAGSPAVAPPSAD